MFRWRYLSVILGFGLVSCGGDRTEPLADSPAVSPPAQAYWNRPMKVPLTPDAERIVASWPTFTELDRSFDLLTRTVNEQELKLAVNDLLEKEAAMAKQRYPVPFDQSPVKSRQKVMRTYLLKLQWELDQRDSVTQTVDDLANSYNAFRKKLNYLLLNPIDTLSLESP